MDDTHLEDEALRLVLRKPAQSSTSRELPLEHDDDHANYYTPVKVSTSVGQVFDVRCGHVGLSALVAAARIVMPWTNKSYRRLMEVWACEKIEDVARKQKDIQNRIFLKNNEYAAAREQRRVAIRNKELEKASLEAPFAPKISEYAKHSSAPKSVNEFFPRGLEWKQRKEKKLEALRAKERQEREEEEAEDVAAHRWKLSVASTRILQRAQQRRESNAPPESPPLSPSERLSRRAAASPSPSSTARKASVNEAHHTPILSNRSRELTKDLPPFDYRLHISCERKQNILRQHAHAQAIRVDIPDGIEEVRKGPFLSNSAIADVVDRLHFVQHSRVEDPNTTFKPQITPRAQCTPPRVLTPTRRQQAAESEGRRRRQAAELRLRQLDDPPNNRSSELMGEESTPSSSIKPLAEAEDDDFLFRAALWSKQKEQRHRALQDAAAQHFERQHTFRPVTSPVSAAMVSQQRHRDANVVGTTPTHARVETRIDSGTPRGAAEHHRFMTLDDHLKEASRCAASSSNGSRFEQRGAASLTASSITALDTFDAVDDDGTFIDNDAEDISTRRPLEDLAAAPDSDAIGVDDDVSRSDGGKAQHHRRSVGADDAKSSVAQRHGGSGHGSSSGLHKGSKATPSPQRPRRGDLTSSPRIHHGTDSPLRQPRMIDDLVRYGLHGKRPQRASFESPFRDSGPATTPGSAMHSRQNPAAQRDTHQQQQLSSSSHTPPQLFFPAALEELKVTTPQRRSYRGRADAASSPQGNDHSHRRLVRHGRATPTRVRDASRNHAQDRQQHQPLFLDAATTAELRAWWDELVLADLPLSHRNTTGHGVAVQPPLPSEVALRAAAGLVEAVCGRLVKRHVAKEVALEFNERIHFADFVLMFQRLSSAT